MKNTHTSNPKVQINSFPKRLLSLEGMSSTFKTENQTVLLVILTPVQKQNREKRIIWSPRWIIGNVLRAAAPVVCAYQEKVKRSHKKGFWMSSNSACNSPWEKPYEREWLYLFWQIWDQNLFPFVCFIPLMDPDARRQLKWAKEILITVSSVCYNWEELSGNYKVLQVAPGHES